MTKPITIDPHIVAGGLKVTGDVLVIDLDDAAIARAPAAAIATGIARGITEAGWVKTGTLAGGIKAELAGDVVNVTAPADRLQRDPALVEKLAAAVPQIEQPITPEVKKAIEAAIAASITVGRRR